MRIIILRLEGGSFVNVNPAHITHFEQQQQTNKALLWLQDDKMPMVIDERYEDLADQINNAMSDDGAIYSIRNEFVTHATALLLEMRRLQWAFGGVALVFIILLLIIVGRT